MPQLSEKELSAINDILSSESLLVKKFNMLGSMAKDPQIADQMHGMADVHQSHFNQIYQQLGGN